MTMAHRRTVCYAKWGTSWRCHRRIRLPGKGKLSCLRSGGNPRTCQQGHLWYPWRIQGCRVFCNNLALLANYSTIIIPFGSIRKLIRHESCRMSHDDDNWLVAPVWCYCIWLLNYTVLNTVPDTVSVIHFSCCNVVSWRCYHSVDGTCPTCLASSR